MNLKEFKATTHLSGPTSITRLKSRKYNKDIYLIGDIHGDKSGQCQLDTETKPPFRLYLDTFFKLNKNKEKYFDYLAEAKFIPSVKENVMDEFLTADTVMIDTFNHFKKKGCFSFEKESMKKCREEYPNVRFHLTDFRENLIEYKMKNAELIKSLVFSKFIIDWVFAQMKNEKMKENMTRHLLEENYDKEEILSGLEMISSKTLLKQKIKEFINSNIIQSQLKKCDKKIQGKLNKIMNKEIKRLNEILNKDSDFFIIIKKVIKIFKKKKKTIKDVNYIFENAEKIRNIFTDVFSRILDFYILARLFKKFNDKERPYMKNVFIHMGESHISFIRETMIDILKFKEVEHVGIKIDYKNKKMMLKSGISRCLDIKNMKLPFFK